MNHFPSTLFVFVSVVLSAATLHAGEIESFAEPYHTINVAAVESGVLVGVFVEEGASVSKGQALADLNQDVLKATLDIARAARDGDSSLRAAEAELRLRENLMGKLKELRQGENASEEEVNRAILEFDLAHARLLAAREQQEVKKLEYDRIQYQLDQRTVKSPIDGIVTQIHKDVGEFLAPTEPIVMTIVQLDPLKVTFSVPVGQVAALRTMSKVSLRIEGSPQPREAEVELVSQVINAESQTVRVKVKLPNPKLDLRSGAKCSLLLPDNVTKKPAGAARPPRPGST